MSVIQLSTDLERSVVVEVLGSVGDGVQTVSVGVGEVHFVFDEGDAIFQAVFGITDIYGLLPANEAKKFWSYG